MAIEVNLDGKAPQGDIKREYIAEDNYDAVLNSISDMTQVPVFGKPGETTQKVIFGFTIQVNQEKTVDLQMYVRPKVTKGSGDYQNSKMFNVLEKAGVLEAFKKEWDLIKVMDTDQAKDNAFINFLRDNFMNKACRVSVKTINKGKPEQYSAVNDIVRFG